MAKEATGRREAKTPARRIHELLDWAMEKFSWVPAVLSTTFGAASAVLFLFVVHGDDLEVAPLVVGIVLQVLAIALTILVEVWRRKSREGEAAEAAQLQLTITDAIQPIVREISRMQGEPSTKRALTLERILGLVASAMPVLLPKANRLRVVVYRVEQGQGRKRRLKVAYSAGRKDGPRDFVDGDGGRGEAAFKWLQQGETLFVADLVQAKLPGWEGSGRGYKTFISCPISYGTESFGMLTVDAPVPGDLDETDRPLIEVIAALLAAAFLSARKA